MDRNSVGATAIAGGADGYPISVSGARVVVVVGDGGGDVMMANGAADGGSGIPSFLFS